MIAGLFGLWVYYMFAGGSRSTRESQWLVVSYTALIYVYSQLCMCRRQRGRYLAIRYVRSYRAAMQYNLAMTRLQTKYSRH